MKKFPGFVFLVREFVDETCQIYLLLVRNSLPDKSCLFTNNMMHKRHTNPKMMLPFTGNRKQIEPRD